MKVIYACNYASEVLTRGMMVVYAHTHTSQVRWQHVKVMYALYHTSEALTRDMAVAYAHTHAS